MNGNRPFFLHARTFRATKFKNSIKNVLKKQKMNLMMHVLFVFLHEILCPLVSFFFIFILKKKII